ncbi:discoidin domain-containing protein [Campylobacter vicugnae]|uniref:galactose-binding domain-containing protein n=1 Tax=Campylobacter vicugnae TaxID=1660076 RepID=UPI0030CF8D37
MTWGQTEPNIVWKDEDLIEIAHDKNAFQSSISKWSLKDDAKRAIKSDLKVDDYAFHTGIENNPWWIVDLENTYDIEYIKIINRKNYQDRLKSIKVEFSIDKNLWFAIDRSLYDFRGGMIL